MEHFIKYKTNKILIAMIFKPPEIEVERHMEMRVRRVFPINLESSLRQSYEEALRKLKEATELEKQAYQLTMERAILEHRLSIWDWLGRNLEELSKSLMTGNYESAKSLIQAIQEEAKRRLREEQNLLDKVKSGESVSTQINAPIITRTSSSSNLSSGFTRSGSSGVVITSQPTQPSSQAVSQTTQSYVDRRNEVLSKLDIQAQQTGQTYVVSAKDFGATGGYYVVTPQGGYSTATPVTQGFSSYQPLFSPTRIPAFNPFQQSGFYNPFR
jgi:hypothetical protein